MNGPGSRWSGFTTSTPPGLLAWFVGMRLMRMTPQDGPTVRLWDNAVVPVARALENRVRVPFGQSVFAVGRVRG